MFNSLLTYSLLTYSLLAYSLLAYSLAYSLSLKGSHELLLTAVPREKSVYLSALTLPLPLILSRKIYTRRRDIARIVPVFSDNCVSGLSRYKKLPFL
jgi:hypothetical protein